MSGLELDRQLLSELYNRLVCVTKRTARAMGKDDTISFKKGLWFEWEGGKQNVHGESKSVLRCTEWSGAEDSSILSDVRNALGKALGNQIGQSCTLLSQPNVIAALDVFNGSSSTPPPGKIYQFLYDLFTSPIDEKTDGAIFDGLSVLFDKSKGLAIHSYPVISYLFFLKDENEYVTVRPKTNQYNLSKLQIDRKLIQECSWSNYRELNCIMKQIQDFLKEQMPDEDISLIDAQSFFWMLHRVNGGEGRA